MAAPGDRRSGIDGRPSMSMRNSMRLSAADDDEDYALEAMGVSDGFRPSGNNSAHMFHDQPVSRRASAIRNTPGQAPPRPSSITKPKNFDNFALRHDGGMGPVTSRDQPDASSSHTNNVPLRTVSMSTDTPILRNEEPYQGPSGPSHPYQMYPQDTRLARTASIATTSTVPVHVAEQSYSGPSGPTHPYGMYPQNTAPESESEHDRLPATNIPVGFPGLNNNYQRRLGPEGEEAADIIGPDGHTEQLPPYSRFPDEGVSRKNGLTVDVPRVVAPAADPPQEIPGAGGIGLATRDPAYASREELVTPQSRHSTRSILSDASNHQINVAAQGVAEKKPLKKWQVYARRKVCGVVPVWAIFLVACGFFIMGIVIGTILAVLAPHRHKGDDGGANGGGGPAILQQTITLTTTFDASPLTAVPSGIPTLPTGTFMLPLQTPYTEAHSCIDNPGDTKAWSCNVPPETLEMVITSVPNNPSTSNNEVIFQFTNITVDNTYLYGSQPPVLDQAQVLQLVSDDDDDEWGPAWWFQVPYNKLVIVEENALSPAANKKRSSLYDISLSERGVVMTGDQPWFCFWNGTLLEAFIYVNQTSSYGNSTYTSATATISSTTATETASQSYKRRRDSLGVDSTATVTSSTSQATGYAQNWQQPEGPGPYPKIIKIEERRVSEGSQSVEPYCIQMQIMNDGSASPVSQNGVVNTIYLNETEPDYSLMDERAVRLWGEGESPSPVRERQSQSSCGCEWLPF